MWNRADTCSASREIQERENAFREISFRRENEKIIWRSHGGVEGDAIFQFSVPLERGYFFYFNLELLRWPRWI